jgi:hypothetical protein
MAPRMQKTHWLLLAMVAAAGVAFAANGETRQPAAHDETPERSAPHAPAGDRLPAAQAFGADQKLPPGHPPIDGAAPPGVPQEANDSKVLEGTIAEVVAVERYSYVRLTTAEGEAWAAVPGAQIAVGRRIRVVNALAMRDFKSPSLGRTFALVYFGTLGEVSAR